MKRSLWLGSVVISIGLCTAVGLARMGGAVEQRAAPPSGPPPAEAKIEQLARDIQRAQDLRTVKELQYMYIQLAEVGMWDEMGRMFSENAEGIFGDQVVRSREAIARHLLTTYGQGKVGLPVGGVHVQLFQAPVVTLSVDGKSAIGRWQKLVMLGRHGGEAAWEGGMEVNTYVKDATGWKIAQLRYYRQFAGPYDTGWFSTAKDLPIVPYHYTPSLAGRPVPDEAGDADRTPTNLTLPELERRVTLMNDEDTVRNLQNIYGYYVDRKMWDDVTDLFATDGVLEVAGVGIYQGVKGIRRALERDGPIGLRTGQVNDHLQFHTIVTVDPSGMEATARGLDLGMLTPKLGEAYWSESVFVNRFVKQDGTWRIREMRIFPRMKSDYYQGWGKSAIIDPAPGPEFAPDRPSSLTAAQAKAGIPAFGFPNLATGTPVRYPDGAAVIATDRLLPAPVAPASGTTDAAPLTEARLANARRKLNISKAYDAVENISSTFGYYLDDWVWDEFVELMAAGGTRPQGQGFYVGREHMYRSMMQSHLAPWSPSNPRDGVRLHTRIQPVIDVAPDASTAKIRTRMFLYFANSTQPGAWNSGMYPNDTAILEAGAWKMNVGGVIDETYFNSSGYKLGWAKPDPNGRGRGRGAGPAGEAGEPQAARGTGPQGGRGVSRNGNPIDFPPDIPWSNFDDFRRKGFRDANWPEIKPMWFHYRNPVSGRTPPNYCPDILTCYKY